MTDGPQSIDDVLDDFDHELLRLRDRAVESAADMLARLDEQLTITNILLDCTRTLESANANAIALLRAASRTEREPTFAERVAAEIDQQLGGTPWR